MTETPEERKRRLLSLIINGPSWRHPVCRLRWALRQRRLRRGFVRLAPAPLGRIKLRVRQPDGSTKRVTWEADVRREYWPGEDHPRTRVGPWQKSTGND